MKKIGKVILVGAGPGDAGLLTIRGKDAITQADCILYDRLASDELLLYAKPDCELIYVGKENHHHTMPQEQIHELLEEKAKRYRLIVRLKGGDGYVFGRGGEEGIFLKSRGIPFEVVPGVTSAIAGAAYAGIPVTHRGVATGFHVLTAHSKDDRLSDIDFSTLTNEKETCIFLMGLSHVAEVSRKLMEAGRSADTPAAVISHATTPQQRCCVGMLSTIAQEVKRMELTSPAIIVVGDVVTLRNQLNCMEERPLSGRRYLVPMIKNHASDRDSLAALLRKEGAYVKELPIGEITFLHPKEAFTSFPDWLIFTSQNGVDAFFGEMKQQKKDARALAHTKIAAIGTKTQKRLESYGLFADFLPSEANSRTFAAEFAKLVKKTDEVWQIRAAQAGEVIAETLSKICRFSGIVLYENRNVEIKEDEKSALAQEHPGMDGIFFTSASAAERLMALGLGMPKEIYSIGPQCTKKIKELGIGNVWQAKEASYESLVELAKERCFLL